MRTADHMNLSRYIMDHMDAGASKLQKAAFIFGSIEPDINMLTYFRGSIRGEEKLRGHNYENVMKYMEKLTKKLEKGGMGTVRQSFLLGKLVHYVADHQYAQPTVVKEPFMKENGEIQYKEHIENKLPDAPKRKDRI